MSFSYSFNTPKKFYLSRYDCILLNLKHKLHHSTEHSQKDINPHISHAEQYYKYVMRAFGNQTKIIDKNHYTRYSIKIGIELEIELEQSKMLKYN
jgi:hypothetical protein